VGRSGTQGARSRARELLVQALYQMQMTGHEHAELAAQFEAGPDYRRVDREYFDAALAAICGDLGTLENSIERFADRPLEQLDPVERGILLLGFHELISRADVPPKVVINEAVNMAKRFGAEDGHKYVNAMLDRAAAEFRSPV